MVSSSQSFQEFKESLGVVKALLKIERRYKDPPLPANQKAVEGLRGAAAVLMVAAFEYFLRQVFEEYLSELARHPLHNHHLPDEIVVYSVWTSLEQAMKGASFHQPLGRSEKITRLRAVMQACNLVLDGTLDPKVFGNTESNPNANTVRTMFKNIGIREVLEQIEDEFSHRGGEATARRFVIDKLNEIIQRRHGVAHTANALNISRKDLDEAVKFLEILALLLEEKLSDRVKEIVISFTTASSP